VIVETSFTANTDALARWRRRAGGALSGRQPCSAPGLVAKVAEARKAEEHHRPSRGLGNRERLRWERVGVGDRAGKRPIALENAGICWVSRDIVEENARGPCTNKISAGRIYSRKIQVEGPDSGEIGYVEVTVSPPTKSNCRAGFSAMLAHEREPVMVALTESSVPIVELKREMACC